MINIINGSGQNNKTGGKVIASGGFGCIFQPALKCKTKKNVSTKNRISKLMTKKNAKAEYNEIHKFQKILKQIPNYSDYFLVNDFVLCQPSNLTKSDLQNYKKKCKALNKRKITVKKVNQSLNRLLALNMPYGGSDLKHIPITNQLNDILIRLLVKGILPMNELGVYHCDIKEGNILVQKESTYARLIDWGLSTQYSKGQPIPKILTNRPFQYNVPFSIILFNKYFLKEYHVFLFKENSKPTYHSIQEFVEKFIHLWSKIRGLGHLKLINSRMVELFSQKKQDKKEDKKKEEKLVIYDFTYYYITEYLSQVLFAFTKNGIFELDTYFSTVFIKNIDIWGFVMVYFVFINHKNKNNSNKLFEKIKYMVVHFLFESPTKPIDVNKLIHFLKELFLKI